MDQRKFDRIEERLDTKISMIDEFIARAHDEGISTVEAIAMQNHVRREFSPKQRANFRRQISSLYRGGKIDIKQKQKLDHLLDKASNIFDKHFLKLSRIVPEGQALTAPKGMPDIFTQDLGDRRAKRIMHWLGFKEKAS